MKTTWGADSSITIIDDSIDFCRVVRKALTKSGYAGHISCYPFARAFYDKSKDFPNIVVSDLSMPGDDGLTLHNKIRADGFDGHFVLCTGDAGALDKSGVTQMDMDIFIKPIATANFLERIKSYV